MRLRSVFYIEREADAARFAERDAGRSEAAEVDARITQILIEQVSAVDLDLHPAFAVQHRYVGKVLSR